MKTLALLLLVVVTSAHAGTWYLVDSDYVAGKHYCTYQLQGSNNIQKTIEQQSPCRGVIYG